MNEKKANSRGEYQRVSQEELEGVFRALARVLVLHGEVHPNEGAMLFRIPEEKMPYSFSCRLPNSLVKEVFFSEEAIAPIEASVEYSDEHRIDKDSSGTVSSVYLSIRGQHTDQPGYVHTIIHIAQNHQQGLEFRGELLEEYSTYDGESDTVTQYENTLPIETMARQGDSARDVGGDDIDRVRRIIDYIGIHGRPHVHSAS